MKQSNFTILKKLTRQVTFLPKFELISSFFVLTMLLSSTSLSAKTQNSSIDIYFSVICETCQGSGDGSASVVVSGGTPPYTYQWDSNANNQTTETAVDLTSGIFYNVTVTDSQGETATDSIDVCIDPEGLWIMVSTTQEAGCGPNGIAHVSAMTGVPPYTYLWDDPSAQTTEDAYNLYPGVYSVTVTDSNGCSATDSTIVTGEDGTSIGDRVWFDHNENGIQDAVLEGGVANVYVALHSAGPDGIFYTNDDVQEDWDLTNQAGLYIFDCVEPGEYYIRFAPNTNYYNITLQYQGNDDELDSNADPVTGFTETFVVFQGMPDDLSYDAGVYDACDDFTYGGTIGQNQIICPGDSVETLHTVIPPTGGSGTPEYLWLQSTSGGAFPNPSWMEIPNSNVENYNPGPLYVTTFFIRCIRREGCPTFIIESENYVTITVLDADDEYCTEGGINPFEPEITADIMAAQEIMVKWTTGPENELYYYYVERSFDAENFDAIAVLRGTANTNASNDYHFMDTEPMNGRNVYRIKRKELVSGDFTFSNSVEVFFVDDSQSFIAHPNPVSDILKLEASQTRNEPTTVSLYNAAGQLLENIDIEVDETSVEIEMIKYATGLYFLHIPGNASSKYKILKIVKE